MPLEIFISNSTIKIYINCFCCLLVFLSGKTLNITVPFTFLIKVLFFCHICKVSCASSCSENDWSSVSGLLAHTCTSPLVATPYWGSAFPFRQSFKCIQVTYSKVRVMSMFASCVKLCWSLTSVALEELSEIVVGLNLEASIKRSMSSRNAVLYCMLNKIWFQVQTILLRVTRSTKTVDSNSNYISL